MYYGKRCKILPTDGDCEWCKKYVTIDNREAKCKENCPVFNDTYEILGYVNGLFGRTFCLLEDYDGTIMKIPIDKIHDIRSFKF